MTKAEFEYLRRFLRQRSGLDLGPEKRYLAETRLEAVWRELGLASLASLVRKLMRGDDGTLGQAVVEAMATHETMFFRDGATFEALRSVILPRLVAARGRTRRLRIWSAAASTGQEAYSLGMLITELPPGLARWNISILGTDLSAAAIARARAGVYSQAEVQRGLPILTLLRHFEQGPAGWTASEELRRHVEFRSFNLLDDLAPLGTFDLVLCRNILIYLDTPTKSRLLAKLAGVLAPDGVLCLGAVESAVGLCDELEPDSEARGFSVLKRSLGEAANPLRATG